MKAHCLQISIFVFCGLVCLNTPLSAQTPKNLPAKTGKKSTTPPKNTSSLNASENPYFLKIQIDSLRKEGMSSADITALLNGKQVSNGKTISKTDLVKGIRKTPTRGAAPSTGATNTPPAAPPPAGPSTHGTGPFVLAGLTEAEADDAAEIVSCLTPLNESGRLGAEDLSIIVDEFRIPNLSMLLLVLDRAGELNDPANIFVYVETIRGWLLTNSIGNFPAGQAPATNAWFSQFPAFFKVYAYKGLPATQAYDDFSNSEYVFQNSTWLRTYFRGMDMRQSANAVANGIATAYGYNRNRVLREALHQQNNGDVQQNLTDMVRRFGGVGANGESATTWAVILKMSDVPDGNGGFYPGFTSAEATALLVNAGYSRQDVVTVIHRVYQ